MFFNALFGQLDYSLTIDKIHYGHGEDVPITVTVTNTQDLNITLSWSDHCQATYSVDSEQYNFDCVSIPSEINLAPDSSYSWNYIYEGTDSISSGVHFLQGEVYNYGFTDSLFIHVRDIDTTEVLSYLPMQVGNRWQFLATQGHVSEQEDTSYITITIDSVVNINGLDYYHFDPFFMTDIPSFVDPMFSYIRIDTSRFVVNAIGWDICDDFDVVYLYLDESIDPVLYQHYSLYDYGCYPFLFETDSSYYLTQLDTSSQSIYIQWPLHSGIALVKNLGLGYIYRYYQWNNVGHMYLIAAEINGIVYGEFLGVDDKIIIPDQFSLVQPYPNPFNPIINIDYSVPYLSQVSIRIIDILGREVDTLVDEFKSPESYSIRWDADSYSSGVYFAIMQSGDFIETRKMVLLK